MLRHLRCEHESQRCVMLQERMAKDSGIQSTWYGITCWKVYAQGLASGWAGIMRYGAMFWTPLIVFFIMKGRSSSQGASSEELKHAGKPRAPSLPPCCQPSAPLYAA